MSYTAEVNLICSYCGCNYTIKKNLQIEAEVFLGPDTL